MHKSLLGVKPAGTLLWLGFSRAQPNGWFSRASIVESMHWMVLHRPVELAALTGHVKFAPNDVFGYACGVNGAARQLLRGCVSCGWADYGFGEAVHFFGLRAELQQQQVHPGAVELAGAGGDGLRR